MFYFKICCFFQKKIYISAENTFFFMKNIDFTCVLSELGAGTRGASLGPWAVFAEDPHFWMNQKPSFLTLDYAYYRQKPLYEKAKYIEILYDHLEKYTDFLFQKLQKNTSMQVIFSGDHSNALGTMAGIRKAFPKEKIGNFWIDAHADLHSVYTTPSGNLHGTPLGAALNLDQKELQQQKVSEQVIVIWEKMKYLAGICPLFLPEDLFYLGLRDFEKEEEIAIEKNQIFHQNVLHIRQEGWVDFLEKIQDKTKKFDQIYISFDVDSMDPRFSKGTGTPVAEGFSPEEVVDILNALLSTQKVKVLEITEINPLLDQNNQMAKIVHRIFSQLKF